MDEVNNREEIQEEMIAESQDELTQRRAKVDAWRAKGVEPFGSKYEVINTALEIVNDFETLEGREVSLAGRLMAVRGHGKASFCDLLDMSGRVQLYVKQDELGEEQYELFHMMDIGDIVGVKGTVFRTKRGEISVNVSEIKILSKSLRPLPEKWHGLKDVDTRYRQRYLDLIVNEDVRKTFILRSKIIRAMRRYLDDRGF